MWDRTLLATLAIVSALACSGPTDAGGAEEPQGISDADVEQRARELHERILTIDTHADIPFDFANPAVDPGVRGDRQVDLPKMREGGLDVAFFIVYVGQDARGPESDQRAYEQALTKFAAIRRMAEEMYPDQIDIAHTADDVERIVASGKLVAAIGIENGWPVGNDLSRIAEFHEMGARYITLAHKGHNDIADSAQPSERLGDVAEEHGGLSEFGERVVAEMNRVGILVDVSHVSKKAMLAAARLSEAPVIASHSAARALADHPRNMDDEQLMALRDNGGVIQTVALDAFVKEMPEGAAEGERPTASVADFVDHIDYMVELIGIDHVAISSDFDGGGGVEGWNDASETANVTIELVRRGYSDEDIEKIWSGNTLRVWREAEAVARRLQEAGG